MDVTGILAGTMSLQEAGDKIYDEVFAVLNGKLTKCEVLKERTSFANHHVGLSI